MTAEFDSAAGEGDPSALQYRGDVDPDELRGMFFELVSLIAEHLQDVDALARMSTLAAEDLVGNWELIVSEASLMGIVVMNVLPGTHLLSRYPEPSPWVMPKSLPSPPLQDGPDPVW